MYISIVDVLRVISSAEYCCLYGGFIRFLKMKYPNIIQNEVAICSIVTHIVLGTFEDQF